MSDEEGARIFWNLIQANRNPAREVPYQAAIATILIANGQLTTRRGGGIAKFIEDYVEGSVINSRTCLRKFANVRNIPFKPGVRIPDYL